MQNQDDQLRGTYANWESDKLIHAVTKDWKSYDEIALTIMKEELERREIKIVSNDSPTAKNTSLKANKVIVDQSCCEKGKDKFYFGEEIYRCENCENYYHPKCWQENNGCVSCIYQKDLCPNCGKEIKSGALKCKHCGKYINEEAALATGEKIPLKKASEALTYAIVGIFCFGIILEPIAFFKGLKAKKCVTRTPDMREGAKLLLQ